MAHAANKEKHSSIDRIARTVRASLEEVDRPSLYPALFICHERRTMASETSENTIFVRLYFTLCYMMLTRRWPWVPPIEHSNLALHFLVLPGPFRHETCPRKAIRFFSCFLRWRVLLDAMDVREVYFAVSLFVFLIINFCSGRFIIISKKILSKNVLCLIWQINGVSVTSARINIMLGEVNGPVHKVKLLS